MNKIKIFHIFLMGFCLSSCDITQVGMRNKAIKAAPPNSVVIADPYVNGGFIIRGPDNTVYYYIVEPGEMTILINAPDKPDDKVEKK